MVCATAMLRDSFRACSRVIGTGQRDKHFWGVRLPTLIDKPFGAARDCPCAKRHEVTSIVPNRPCFFWVCPASRVTTQALTLGPCARFRLVLVRGQPLEERDIWLVPGDRDSHRSPEAEAAEDFRLADALPSFSVTTWITVLLEFHKE